VSAPGRRAQMLLLLAVLAVAWVLWSGYFKPLLLILGAGSCALTVYLAARMDYFQPEFYALRMGRPILRFWLWLLPEIMRSSLEVARVVLARDLPISPQLVELDLRDLHTVDQVILGNSITLTPGTLTIDLHEGRMQVHALTQAEARVLQDGEMRRRLTGAGQA